MGSGLSTNDPTIVAAFHKALFEQGFAIFLILTLVAVAWSVLRSVQLRRAALRTAASGGSVGRGGSVDNGESVDDGDGADPATSYPEPVARRFLRISFGLLWIFDGILQGQASMPLGLIPQAIQPTASASPPWVQHLVSNGTKIWTYHPVSAAAASVWIQVGIGLWLLAAPRGNWSRLGGVAGVAWGAMVWVFGESFGGIFAPGASWLFGAPGAVLFYCIAGGLIALPDSSWRRPRLGRAILAAFGLFFVGMAVLQAWPGRGFWQGQSAPSGTAGGVTAMVQQMSQTPQPQLISSLVSHFGSFDATHGWAVNLVVVIWLGAVGATFLSGRPREVRAGVIAGAVLCLADWVLIQDFGFFGGVGTDPNSMIPMALVFVAGYLALTRASVTVSVPATEKASVPWRQHLTNDPAYTFRSIAALAAVGITLVGAAPMAFAAANPNADPILTQAVDGPPTTTNIPAPAFDLLDQNGRQVSLAALQGKALAVTFLDPVCTSDCPVIAQEFRSAAKLLGAESQNVELIAIDANPRYTNPVYLTAFDQQEGLQNVPNWEYLTGPLPVLKHVWASYAVEVAYESGGAMIDHSDVVYIIDPAGRTREVLNSDPGPATGATGSAFSQTLANGLKNVLRAG
jgi:cytochrome oxidase Cu insertion factor (SCO1/SenC/PrrC family)